MEKIIDVVGLHKHYGKVHAVKGIDFYVEKGKLFAFLGPNGAGKTTTINNICTLLTFDKGQITISGHQVGKDDAIIRKKIGIVFQDGLLDPLLTVQENLKTRASFYHQDRQTTKKNVEEALKAINITDLAKRRYGKLSGGQKRRADIARALVHQPEILFLDEPTTGLDPQTRRNVWETIANLQKSTGMTVFLTTHYMEEAAKADFVIVIDNGVIVAKGTPNDLKEEYSHDQLQIKPINKKRVIEQLKTKNIDYKIVTDMIYVELAKTNDAIPIIEMLKDDIAHFQVLTGTMDDAFIKITGKEMR
jgi:multidrug/hemolysin transport system ATP-binding protein